MGWRVPGQGEEGWRQRVPDGNPEATFSSSTHSMCSEPSGQIGNTDGTRWMRHTLTEVSRVGLRKRDN